MKFTPLLIFAILIFPILVAASVDAVSVNFDVKDQSGNPIPDVLVIIQGITNPDFSENKLTGSDGKVSFALNSNEFFIYIVYKLSYKEQTDSFFTNTNKDFPITLEKLPEDQWFFYRINNGEIELRFSSPDADTNYQTGEYIKNILEIRNVAGINIELDENKGIFQIVDSQTLNYLRAWGDFIGSGSSDLGEVTLKKDGLVSIALSEDIVKICVSNVKIVYKGTTFDLSGNTFLCIEETQDSNKIPEWILNNKYRFQIKSFYEIDGQEKSIGFTSQEFFIDNIDWKPEIVSAPTTDLTVNVEWTYDVNLKEYDASFADIIALINYKLIEAPEGMTIDVNTGLAKWTPTINGNYSVIARAYHEYFENDAEKITYVDQEFTLKVEGGIETNNPPIITSSPVTQVNENAAYSYQVTATDSDGDALTYVLTQAPAWLSINSNTGLVSGTTPEVNANTNFDVAVQVSDSEDIATQTYTLTVIDVPVPPTNNPPVITSNPLTQVNENASYNYQVTTTDADGDILAYSMTGPSWLSINSNTGLVSGTAPGVSVDTNFDITISVSDGADVDTQSYLLTVVNIITPPPANNPPVITSTPITMVNENQGYSYQVTATDADNDTLTYSLTQAPSWLSINGAGLISGTAPEVSADTDFDVAVSVTDGTDIATQNYVLMVINIVEPPPANNPPVIISTPVTQVTERRNYIYQVNATDADGDALTYNLTQAPEWLTINQSTGLISGVAPRVNGRTEFTVVLQVSDAKGGNVSQNYVLVVRETSDSKSKDKNLPLVDEFYEKKYFEQFNAPEIIVSSVSTTNIPSVTAKNMGAIEKIITDMGSTVPILIILNLTITAFIILKTTPTRKEIDGNPERSILLSR